MTKTANIIWHILFIAFLFWGAIVMGQRMYEKAMASPNQYEEREWKSRQ